MEEYLKTTKEALESGVPSKVHAVLGNESCDLDSAVSALAYAYYLHKARPAPDTEFIPVLNISRADFPLRTEVTHHFNKLKVNLQHLTFRDELDLSRLHKGSKLTLTLVDHNVLSAADVSLDGAVVEVIDHHNRERCENENESVTVEAVGSCCTLVAEKLLNDASFQIDHQMAALLYGPTVLDTINLSADAGIKTPKDVDIIDKLQTLLSEGAPSRQDVYSDLLAARSDITDLSTFDVLRKDLKVVTSPQVKVVFSSIPVQLETFFLRDDVVTSLRSFATHQRAAVVILMSLSISTSGEPQRQMAVFSEDTNLREKVVDLLKASTEPALQLSALTSQLETITVFTQGNVQASRKKVLPHIQSRISSILFSKAEPDFVRSPSGDSGVVVLSPTTPETTIAVPNSIVGDHLVETKPDLISLPSPNSEKPLGLALSQILVETSDELGLAEEWKEGTSSLITLTGVTADDSTTDASLTGTVGSALDDLLGLNLEQAPFEPVAKVTAESLVTISGVTTDATTTDLVSVVSLQATSSLDVLPNSTTAALITEAEITTEDTTDAVLVEADRETPSPDVIPDVDNLTGNKQKEPATGLLTPAGVTTDDTTTDAAVVDTHWETPSPDSIPDSVKPGGLLDLDFFASKEEIHSGADSEGSLDNYENDAEPKDVPARSEQEVLDLISDALQEDLKAKSPSPSHNPDTAATKVEEPAVETSSKEGSQMKEEVHFGGNTAVRKDLLDPFEHHEGVLIEASPIQGVTPDPSATPDNLSQPISPQSHSYPGTPPNSYIDLGVMDTQRGQRDLPSFMNADMVRRIHEKKAALSVIDEQEAVGISGHGDERFPFTPQNSVSDESHGHLIRQQALPSFDNAEMVQVVHTKRADISGDKAPANSEATKFPYTPPNSFVDSSFAEMNKRGGPLHLVEEDFADRMNKKKHKFAEEASKGSFEEITAGRLVTEATGNVPANATEKVKGEQEEQDIRGVVNDCSENVVAFRIAEDMKARADLKEIHDLVNERSGNVVAYRIAQDMKEHEAKKGSPLQELGIWDEKTVRYTGVDEIDVANQLTNEVLQRALSDLGSPGESLQAELAQAERKGFDEQQDSKIELVAASAFDRITDIEQEHIDHLLNTTPGSHQGTALKMLAQGNPLDDQAHYESLSQLLPAIDPMAMASQDIGLPQDGDEAARHLTAGGVGIVTFADQASTHTLVAGEIDSRPHSDSLLSETSTGGDSDLSQNTKQFLARLRTDTGASILSVSGNSEDLMIAAQQMDVANVIVNEAMSAAVEIVSEQDQAKEDLTRQGEWDAETLKTRMDQLPEQHVVTMDTAVSTSVEADEGNRMSPNRPDSLESTPKKRIVPNLALLRDEQLQEPGQAAGSPSSSEGVPLDSLTDLPTPDDLNTPEALGDSVFEGELDWEDSDASEDVPVPPIPEYTAQEEFEDEKNWRSVTVGDRTFRIDMKVIEPYKRVLSHGGYYGDGFNAIIVFTGYYLPDKRRRDYNYVMDNLFLYVLSTLELLVVEDYMVVYFHGATPKQRMPSLRWLKRCYEMIDRRLRKNLKSLLIVHPTLWIKTIMTLTKPFISSKFSSKLKYVRGLKELADAVPMEYIFVPDEIKMFDEAKFRQSAPAAT